MVLVQVCCMYNALCVYMFIGVQCTELMPPYEEYVIENCTSGITRVGYLGDTCIISYNNSMNQVIELWSCQDNREWRTISGIT